MVLDVFWMLCRFWVLENIDLFSYLMVVVMVLSHDRLSSTLWTVACQAPLSVGCPRKNTEVGYHFLLQGIFLTQG